MGWAWGLLYYAAKPKTYVFLFLIDTTVAIKKHVLLQVHRGCGIQVSPEERVERQEFFIVGVLPLQQ